MIIGRRRERNFESIFLDVVPTQGLNDKLGALMKRMLESNFVNETAVL